MRLLEKVADIHRRTGFLGVLHHCWTFAFGALIDLNVMVLWRRETSGIVVPDPPRSLRFAQVVPSLDSPVARAAAALMQVDLARRLDYLLFVALDAHDEVTACSWSATPP